eukprot:scaffold363_cov209-Alexandrium_tamarense.AAC.15
MTKYLVVESACDAATKTERMTAGTAGSNTQSNRPRANRRTSLFVLSLDARPRAPPRTSLFAISLHIAQEEMLVRLWDTVM